jgi:putative ABC transport system permease protein
MHVTVTASFACWTAKQFWKTSWCNQYKLISFSAEGAYRLRCLSARKIYTRDKETAMFRNYFKTAFRNLWRAKTFSIINVAGLALGIAVFLLIFQYVAFEWGFNRFHASYKQLYRASVVTKEGEPSTYEPPGLIPIASEKIPGIEKSVRVAEGIGGGVITYKENGSPTAEDKSLREDQMLYVDGNFLEAFSFPLVDGAPSLQAPKTLAISESLSQKLFSRTNVAGETVTLHDQFGNTPYTITAVFKDMPENSDIRTNVLVSLQTLANPANRDDNDWADPAGMESSFVTAYFLLKKEASPAAVAKELTTVFGNAKKEVKDEAIVLQPFSQIHLAPSFTYALQTFGSLKLVVMLLAVSLLILCIGWVNYINLSTVQALKRARETGVRKVFGASLAQLRIQYLTETFLLTLASTTLALLLVAAFQNTFNAFTGKNLSLALLNQGWFWAAAVFSILAGSFLSGGYVAFVLSSFKPVTALRGKTGGLTRGLILRKGLVVFQFTISIIFIVATVVLYKQLHFMKAAGSGLKLDQLLVVKGPTVSTDGQAERNESFKNALAQLPFVKKTAASNNVPGKGYNFSSDGITKEAPQKGDDKKAYKMFICDNNYFDTYGLTLAQGRTFTKDEADDGWNKTQKLVLNEKAARQLGFAPNENLVGKKVLWGKDYQILGVVKDYNHLSLQQAIEPMIFLPSESFGYFTVQTGGDGMQHKLDVIRNLYKQSFPGNPFEYFFADDTYNKQYAAEEKLGNVFTASAMVAILIACLGLFGLAAFTAQQRIKEIGVRKVLGASVTNIVQLLSKDFVGLVALSIGIATPIAWWALNNWLQNFAYRTSISWWVFAVAGGAAVIISLATISFQAIKAAVANPVKSLRNE